MCFLLHEIKGKSFVLLHRDRDNFFANSIAVNENIVVSNLLNGEKTSFVLITRSKVAGFVPAVT